ncbi:MAG: hypothetical protein ACLFP2_04785 [Candidatus Woesearchaeota archaeon]
MNPYEHMRQVVENLYALKNSSHGLNEIIEKHSDFIEKVANLQDIFSMAPWTVIGKEGFPAKGSMLYLYDTLPTLPREKADITGCIEAILTRDKIRFNNERNDYLNARIAELTEQMDLPAIKEIKGSRLYQFAGRWVAYDISANKNHAWDHSHFADLNNPAYPVNKIERLTIGPVYTRENALNYDLKPSQSIMAVKYENTTYQKRRSLMKTVNIPNHNEHLLIITNSDLDIYDNAEVLKR